MIQQIDVKKLKSNDKNPRNIKNVKFEKLVKSIKAFPEMLEKRPIIAVTVVPDQEYLILGGNMRHKASVKAKLKTIPVMLADDWTQDQRDEFLIKDNVSSGEWDFDRLANEWDNILLGDWDVINFVPEPIPTEQLESTQEEDDVPLEEKSNIPNLTDAGFTKLEVILLEDDKKKAVATINEIRNRMNCTMSEAFMELINTYKISQ